MTMYGHFAKVLTLCTWLYFLFDIGYTEDAVRIQVTSPIELQKDDLEITCSAQGDILYITSYTLYKNDSMGMVKQVVQQTYLINESSVVTTWTDTSLRVRANLTNATLPSPQATMVLTVNSDLVRYPEDAAGYRCDFSAIVSLGGDSPVTQSNMELIEINNKTQTTTPTSTGNTQTNSKASIITMYTAILFMKFILAYF